MFVVVRGECESVLRVLMSFRLCLCVIIKSDFLFGKKDRNLMWYCSIYLPWEHEKNPCLVLMGFECFFTILNSLFFCFLCIDLKRNCFLFLIPSVEICKCNCFNATHLIKYPFIQLFQLFIYLNMNEKGHYNLIDGRTKLCVEIENWFSFK